MILRRPDSGRLSISEPALEKFKAYRQMQSQDTEAGGLLLGRLIVGTDDIVIDEATSPSTKDRRSRFAFRRSKRPAQNRVDAAWAESASTRVYLGEWHTHPEADPSPSLIDRCNWKKIVARARFEQMSLHFVIVGRSRIRAWEVNKKTGRIDELVPVKE